MRVEKRCRQNDGEKGKKVKRKWQISQVAPSSSNDIVRRSVESVGMLEGCSQFVSNTF